LGALSYPFWYWYASAYSGNVGDEFFHAAADILPVLLLATILDVRRTNELEGKQLVPPVAAVFFGELAALNALAFSDGGDMVTNFAAVSSSLVTATFALIIAVMADLSPSDDRPEDGESRMAITSKSEPVMADPAYVPESKPDGTPGKIERDNGQ
jgi:hypothetical protein